MENKLIEFKTSKASFTIIPSLGGCIADLRLFNGKTTIPVIESYQSFDDADAKAFYKSHYLLPFPNRMRDGQFEFEGQQFQFPINDKTIHHNLHGFPETIPMNITSKESNDKELLLILTGIFEGVSYYPFPFSIELEYCLSDSELAIKTTIKNTGKTNLPIGYGWHPYFKLDIEKSGDLKMKLPDCKMVEVDDRMMPTGVLLPYDTFSDFSKVETTVIDNCFLLEPSSNTTAEIQIQSPTTTLTVWQETGENACNYFQIFTPDHRRTVAIEPMTCNVDAFNNHEGLWVLAPDEERSVQFGVKLNS